MGELTYYLPEIMFGVFALVAIIWGILFVRDMVRRSGGKATCTHCKGNASKLTSPPYLFLLPISFGTKYDNPESYLRSHMVPILRKDRIPTGRRACHVDVYQCEKCGKKQVIITDFLQVRGDESVEGTYVYPYENFEPLLKRWEAIDRPPEAYT